MRLSNILTSTKKVFYLVILASFLEIGVIAPEITLAQALPPLPPSNDPSRIQQQLQPPPPPRPNENLTVPRREELTPPPGAEQVKFRLNNLEVAGATVYSPERLRQVYAKLLGRDITLGDLYQIAARITQLYRQDGYIISQAIVPEQTINNGVAKIQIIEGFVERVDFTGAPEPILNRLRGFGNKIVSSRPLKLSQLERYLLLANDLAGIQVRAVLSPGNTLGAAILTANVDYKPGNTFFDINNRGSASVGPERAQAGLFLNSPLGQGERITISGATTFNTSELADTSAVLSVPIGFEGWRFSLNGDYTNVRPGSDLRKYNINGDTYSATLGVVYPIIRSRNSNFYFNSNFDYTNRILTTLVTGTSETLNKDRLRVIRAGLNFDRTDSKGVTNGGMQISQGIGGLGATTEGTTSQPLSRAQGEAAFTKVNLNLSRLQALPSGFAIEVATTAQITGNALLVSEQFGLGGEEFGRAFEPSQVIGDSGYGIRAELQRQFASNILGGAFLFTQPYIFYDYGQVYKKFPTKAENPQDTLSSAGLGLRLTLNNALLLQGELAFPITRTDTRINHDPSLFFTIKGFF